MVCTSGLAQMFFVSVNQNLQHLPQGLNLALYVWYMPHDNVSGNCVRLMIGDIEPLQISISASHFCNGTKQFC